MNIFSEIYGAYFRVVQRLLESPKFTKTDIFNAVSDEAFSDSVLFIEPKLLPDSDGNSDWGLIKRNADKTFSPITKNPPVTAVTALQKSWLKAKLNDKRFKLFVGDEALARLEKRLEAVPPLYGGEDFYTYDIYSDGDDYDDAEYRENFGKILNAVKTKEILKIKYLSGHGEKLYGRYVPLKLEYSRKNDKFRAYCYRIKNGCPRSKTILNLGKIKKVKCTGLKFDGAINDNDENSFSRYSRCKEPVELTVTSERNGIERFMMEFASFEKRTELDMETGKCHVLLYYDRNDETEILIRLLGYGPVLEVLGPENIRSQMKERVKKQYNNIAMLHSQ